MFEEGSVTPFNPQLRAVMAARRSRPRLGVGEAGTLLLGTQRQLWNLPWAMSCSPLRLGTQGDVSR